MKTGGMTLSHYLRTHFDRETLFPYRELDIAFEGARLLDRHHLELSYLLGLPQERRDRIRGYTGHFPYLACELLGGDFVTLTILRDPTSRTLSLLRQFQRRRPWTGPNRVAVPAAESRTLEDAYQHPNVYEHLVHNHQTKMFSMMVEDAPTSYMEVIDVDESRLALAKENLAKVDVVGLTEAYSDFLSELRERFGWQVPPGRRVNASPRDGSDEPSEALLRRIADDNAIDIEFYEYAKQLVEQRRGGRPVET
jgi:hypothetical protein